MWPLTSKHHGSRVLREAVLGIALYFCYCCILVVTLHPLLSSSFRPRPRKQWWEQSCQVCVCSHRPQQYSEEATCAHHLPPHCWQQQHTAQLWRGRRHSPAHPWRTRRVDVRRTGEEWKVSRITREFIWNCDVSEDYNYTNKGRHAHVLCTKGHDYML